MPHALILCLGDVGRSPRMQYHADAFTRHQQGEPWTVELMGYEGSPCFPHILSNPSITLHLFPSSHASSLTTVTSRWKKLLLAPLKVLKQSKQLLEEMISRVQKRPDIILVQNPPSIPTLILALLASYIHDSALIIDWHNFGYTLLGLNFGAESWIVKIAREYERRLGQFADGHLCVTQAMKGWLKDEWEIDAHPLHDRSQSHFHRLSACESHHLFHSLLSQQGLIPELKEWCDTVDGQRLPKADIEVEEYRKQLGKEPTPFTYQTPTAIHFRPDRPTLIISSTSWTADEDFTILARAIERYDKAIIESRKEEHTPTLTQTDDANLTESTLINRGAKHQTSSASSSPSSSLDSSSSPSQSPSSSSPSFRVPSSPLPRAVFLITGKGPLRDAFLRSIRALSLVHTQVHCLFVSASEYPQLLGSADLGVSLHYSSSGLDLPMKVVDMFATGLPVCAVRFKSISELVQDGVNGRIFGADPSTPSATLSSSPSQSSSSRDPSVELSDQLIELFSELTPTLAATRAGNESSLHANAMSVGTSSPSPPSPSSATLISSLSPSSAAASSTPLIQLDRLHLGAVNWSRTSWQDCWDATVGPMITRQELEYQQAERARRRKSVIARIIATILILVGLIMMLT